MVEAQAPFPYHLPAGFQRGDVDTGDIRLSYWRRGRGRPLLVLHGVAGWGLDWARFARRVEGQFDCLLLDQRGHGYSDKPAGGYGYAGLAKDAWQIVQQLDFARPAVLGHSLGGGVALRLAAEHPDAIDRLVLVDPAIQVSAGGESAPPRPPAEQRSAQLRRRQALGRRALAEQLRAARPTFDPEDVANTVESTLLASPSVYSGSPWFDAETQRAQLRSLSCPTLVVHGEPARGAITTDAAAASIRALVPHDLARVLQIAGTGHVPQREAFDLFVALVLPFLSGDTAPADEEGGSPACFLHLLDEDGTPRHTTA